MNVHPIEEWNSEDFLKISFLMKRSLVLEELKLS